MDKLDFDDLFNEDARFVVREITEKVNLMRDMAKMDQTTDVGAFCDFHMLMGKVAADIALTIIAKNGQVPGEKVRPYLAWLHMVMAYFDLVSQLKPMPKTVDGICDLLISKAKEDVVSVDANLIASRGRPLDKEDSEVLNQIASLIADGRFEEAKKLAEEHGLDCTKVQLH